MLRHIQQYIEGETLQTIADENWSMQVEGLEAYIGISYVLGALGAKVCGQDLRVKIFQH